MARTYTKRNDEYWQNRKNTATSTPTPQVSAASDQFAPFPDIVYGSTQVATAADPSGGANSSETRGRGLLSGLADNGAFQNIAALKGPFASANSENSISISEACSLCVKAYGGVPVVRNAVEVSVEFSSQPLEVKCKNATVLEFFQEWLKITNIASLEEQFFRSYYREGSTFIYPFYGQFGSKQYENFQKSFGAVENRIPIRYELLNPATIHASSSLALPYTYVRMLSPWEAERLKNPITPQDKQVYDDLPKEVKRQIESGAVGVLGLNLPLDPKRLRFTFYKKQGFEPFGVPFIWPVLPSVEWKLALTKMDMALARTIEHAILLVTTGETGNQWNKGNGINPNNIARLQNMFSNHTIGRVLVADFTTQAKWLIPDIQEILGPEKYQIVNEDIKDGLQSILTGSDKFANAQIKAKIFIQRLQEGQNRFLNEFLMPEIRAVCRAMNFRTVPSISFRPIDLSDASVLARIFTQLGQLGILTPEQTIEAIQTGTLPDADEMKRGQEQLKKDRDKGLYQPQVGGKDNGEGTGGANGRPGGTSGIKQGGTRSSSPIGTSRASVNTHAFSMKTYGECLRESQTLEEAVAKALRKKYKVKGPFSEAQAGIARTLVKAVIATEPRGKWNEAVASAVVEPPAVSAEVGRELTDICLEYHVDDFDAAILRHCKTEAPVAKAAA